MTSRFPMCLLLVLSLLAGYGCSAMRPAQVTQQEMEEQGLALTPEQRLAYGVQMERMGKYKGAEEQYQKVLEAGTHDEEAWFMRGCPFPFIISSCWRFIVVSACQHAEAGMVVLP